MKSSDISSREKIFYHESLSAWKSLTTVGDDVSYKVIKVKEPSLDIYKDF